jgi:16S rRNA (cytosine1402-N4)-methyltransferase
MTMTDEHNLHTPVLQREVLSAFQQQPRHPKKILDGTFGRGGHTRALLDHFPGCQVVAFDRDEAALKFGRIQFDTEISANRLFLVHEDFRQVGHSQLGPFDGALFDLGVSSPQFDEAERGFSFQNDGPLDMRMDRRQTLTAAEIINTYSEKEISDIFFKWGEVTHPNRVVRAIVNDRVQDPFTRTRQLSSLIERVEKAGAAKRRSRTRNPRIHWATPYFMALRIAVNMELEGLSEFFENFPEQLENGGRVAVITFHSLEDRIVKWAFRKAETKWGTIINKKVITATEEEIENNPRARSAKLRIFERGERT